MVESSRRGQATAISDSSFNDKRGTAAYILEANKDGESRMYTVHDTPSRYSDQSPYRSELSGISMMLAVIKCLITCYDITHETISLGLNGKKEMEQVSRSFPLFPEQ